MTLYPEHPPRPRLAVFARYDFPRAEAAADYEALDRVAAAAGADWRMVHTVVADPTPLPPGLRARVGTGLHAMKWPEQHANDLQHLRHTAPAQVADLFTALQAFRGDREADLLARPEVLAAFSAARFVRAHAARVVVAWGLAEGAFAAFVTAKVLALPFVLVLPAARGEHEYGELLPLYAAHAAAIVAIGHDVGAAVAARLPGQAERIVVAAARDDAVVTATVARALAMPRAAAAPALGADAAFVTAPAPPSPTRCRRFLVLGAERTGSNLLVGMLGASPGAACAGELFNARSIATDELGWIVPLADPQELLALRRADPAALLARLWRDGEAGGADLVGWKLLYMHGEADDRVVDAIAGDRELAVVHLLRADRLSRFLSLERARRSDAWFTPVGSRAPDDHEPIALDAQAVATEFVANEQQEARYRAVLRRHRVLELDYGDLAGRLPESAGRLGAFFGRDLGTMVPRSQKTGPRDAATLIANLPELRAAFAGTRWSALFG